MRLTVVNAITLGFAAALLAFAANAIVADRNLAAVAESSREVARSHAIQDALETFLSTVKDAETGERGYIITGEEPYLTPYTDAVTAVHDRLQAVQKLAAGTPGHHARLADLRRLTDAKLAQLARTIGVYRAEGREAAREAVKAGRGKEIMGELRQTVAAMRADEDARLADREAAAATSLRWAVATNAVGGACGAVMVGLAYSLFRRDRATREKARAALLRANDQLEERVRQRTAALQRSNRELQDFAAVASHDLQEPLRKIQAFGDRLATKAGPALDESSRDSLARLLAAAGRMRTLINDLLAFTRVTTKAQPPAPVDLAAIARDVVADLDARLHETGGHVELGELPTVEAEPTQMRQLLQNLIGNALKFHRPGVSPVVRVASRVLDNGAAGGGPPHCELTVADNGIGFDEKYLDRIFTVFQRLHGRHEYDGTGIGLAIVRKIVEQHGGSITAHSRPGEGSAFVVTLPLARSAPKDVA